MHSVAVVTPTHRDCLDFVEILRLKRTLTTLANSPHYFLIPDSIDKTKLQKLFSGSMFVTMPEWYFKSVQHYNILMLQDSLYKLFLEFEYILICQTDAFVIGGIEALLAFDYFGASWKQDYRCTELFGQIFVNRPKLPLGRVTTVSAGNGGLSLRNVSRMMELIAFGKSKNFWYQFERLERRKLNEDVIFSFLAAQLGLKIPTRIEADRFLVETNFFNPKALGSVVGFHALEKYQPGLERLVFHELGMV